VSILHFRCGTEIGRKGNYSRCPQQQDHPGRGGPTRAGRLTKTRGKETYKEGNELKIKKGAATFWAAAPFHILVRDQDHNKKSNQLFK
jgi:hypothetical protein